MWLSSLAQTIWCLIDSCKRGSRLRPCRATLAGRLLALPPLLLGVSVVIFLVLRFSPGDPAERILSDNGAYPAGAPLAIVAALRPGAHWTRSAG
jgi:ABC-type dipeptide/oligopeptide/nickel transport system permease component